MTIEDDFRGDTAAPASAVPEAEAYSPRAPDEKGRPPGERRPGTRNPDDAAVSGAPVADALNPPPVMETGDASAFDACPAAKALLPEPACSAYAPSTFAGETAPEDPAPENPASAFSADSEDRLPPAAVQDGEQAACPLWQEPGLCAASEQEADSETGSPFASEQEADAAPACCACETALFGDAAASPPSPCGANERWMGIRFHKSGQVFFYPVQEHAVRKGTKVLVETEHGPVLGEVESFIRETPACAGEAPSTQGRVLGLATAEDVARHTENALLAAEAEAFCKTCIRQRSLEMKLVNVEVLHDRSKIIFFFTAPARIDFRELVKDLVRNYRTRIELRQIGVRHECQMTGGLGNCGRVCCCHSYLRKFAPVTIKMAKEQNLFLNPAKLSGMCGRLLCCLSFEQGNYEEFNRRCPKIGKKYVTSRLGTVKVLRASMFSQRIALLSEKGEETEISLEEWEGMEPHRPEPHQPEQGAASGSGLTEAGEHRCRQRHQEPVPDNAPPAELENATVPRAREHDSSRPKRGTRPNRRARRHE